MLTQDEIYQTDGSFFPVENRPIKIMDPAPGNGWGCIPPADIIKMFKRLSREQGKPVTVQEVQEAKPSEGRAMRFIGKALLIGGGLYFSIHILIWAVK